jgi:hypothetical protein
MRSLICLDAERARIANFVILYVYCIVPCCAHVCELLLCRVVVGSTQLRHPPIVPCGYARVRAGLSLSSFVAEQAICQ